MNLEMALGIEVEEEEEREVEETLMELGTTVFLTQESEPISTPVVDACNGFNEMIHLEMMWTVRHHWLAGTRFTFNCYRH